MTFAIPLEATNGLTAELEADEDDIDLTISRRGQQAVYFARGKVSEEGIGVRFARFGEFVVDYEPFRTLKTREPGPRCEGEPWTTTEGFFRGTLRFRGEGGYVRIEATRAKGTLVHHPGWKCRYGPAAAARARGRQSGGGEDEATLVAASRRDSIQFAAFGSREAGEKPFTGFWAVGSEVREGVGITRFTLAATAAAGFRFHNRRGTAFVDPPAPFAGSAHYVRRPDAPDGWSGNLTAPLLGLGRVPLTGPGFNARMVPRYPNFG